MRRIDHNVRVEYATHDAGGFVDQLLDHLAGYGAAVGLTPERGWVEVYFTVPACDLAEAFGCGLGLAEAAGAPRCVLVVEVLTTDEFCARVDA